MLIVRVPLRISLGGGGTDLYNWYSKHGSFLITATINKFIYITLSQRNLEKDFWLSYSKIENLKNLKQIKHSIIKKILFKYRNLNNLEIHTISEVPSNSGLGSSGSLSVGLIQALNLLSKNKISSKLLAEKSIDIEMSQNKKNAGKQDQYAAAYGGLLKLSINKKGFTKVEKLKVSKKKIKQFQKNIFLIYIKNRRYASEILKKQSKLINENKTTVEIMKKIQLLGKKSCDILEKGKIDDFGLSLDEHWRLKKKVGSFMTNKKIEFLYNNLKRNGSTGGKVIGAGGGGFLMSYVPKKNHKKFISYLKQQKLSVLDWQFHFEGSKIIFNDEK